jgi:hypothetical protein
MMATIVLQYPDADAADGVFVDTASGKDLAEIVKKVRDIDVLENDRVYAPEDFTAILAIKGKAKIIADATAL